VLFNSSITPFIFRGVEFLVKRDDLLHSDFSGNKARKFYYYFDYLTKNNQIKKIISYGSNQSNAMYSMSVLAKKFNLKFDYYVKHLPSYLIENPIGNYKYALMNGMNVIVDEEMVEKLKKNEIKVDENEIYIKEGGAVKEAEVGIKMLADELKGCEDYNIFLPSGTGATAYFLQKHFEGRVWTCSCVGDDGFLMEQWSEFGCNIAKCPMILPKHKKFHFGKLYRENYEIWLELKKAGIEFDLLYDPIGWQVVMDNLDILGNKILYIHQGGLRGNESMLQRYQRKFGI
jgi:1-aminocyclopropane-1-carboxylate deaminase/D-cysteine desulfhydrase-like pyridoxal-dependent ACC family enzyme